MVGGAEKVVLWRFRGLRRYYFLRSSDVGEGEFSGGSEDRGGTGSQEVQLLVKGSSLEAQRLEEGLVLNSCSGWRS